MNTRNLFVVLALATSGLSAGVVAGCGEDRGSVSNIGGTTTGGTGTAGTTATTATTRASGTSTTAGEPVATVEVKLRDFELDPADPKVEAAGLIEFELENVGQAPHAIEIHATGGEVESEVLQAGGKGELKVELEAGAYEWYCPVGDHEDRGMKGEITVG